MLILGLDFETTFHDPVDPKISRIIEIGACLWDTDTHQPLVLVNRSVYADDYPPFDPRITKLTGMTEENLKKYGTNPKVSLQKLTKLMAMAEAVVAHNGTGFDRPVYESESARHGLVPYSGHWIDSQTDIPYPEKIETRKLEFLAPSHGFLNPFSHRAIFDVLSMLKVVSHYDFNVIYERSKMPEIIIAVTTQKPWLDGGVSNAKAKEFGFKYNGDTKRWQRRIKENELELVSKNCPLTITVLRS